MQTNIKALPKIDTVVIKAEHLGTGLIIHSNIYEAIIMILDKRIENL